MKRLVKYLLKRELSFKVTTNEDGDDYHLEFIIYNEYYEVRTRKEARSLLKYLKEECSVKGLKRLLRKQRKMLKLLERKRLEQERRTKQ